MLSSGIVRQLAACGMSLAAFTYAQSNPRVYPSQDGDHLEELPTRQLTFTASDPVGGFRASPVVILPTQCTSDGSLFLNSLQPPSFMQQAIVEVTPKASLGFDISAIRDLSGATIISYFPNQENVVVLVRATREMQPGQGETQVKQSSYGFFLALFNRAGHYSKSIELDLRNVLPSRVAVLSSGEFLITAYDRANDIPRLYLVGEDGKAIRTLPIPYRLGQYTPSPDPNSAEGTMNHSRVLGSILMTTRGQNVLVWRKGGSGPILSVGEHGSNREISLNVPKGLSVAGVLPSDKLWVVQLQPASHDQSGPQPTSQAAYYQFDPSDGSLTSKLTFRGDSPDLIPATLACEEEGVFLSYRTDDKGRLRILSAR